MNIVITGANGFVGSALTKRLLAQGELAGRAVGKLILIDRAFDETFLAHCSSASNTEWHSGDISNEGWLRKILAPVKIDTIFHLASIPGGIAEQNEALARRVNIGATETLLDITKAQAISSFAPIFVFASSIAVFGSMPDKVTDDTELKPQLSYGAHKMIGEVLINDFSRRGWVDGRSVRLPGVLARPPAATGQLSAFLSNIIHEVSKGNPFVCPMSAEATTWASSLPNIIDNLLHAASIDGNGLGSNRAITLPTLCFSMAELTTALGETFHQSANDLVRYEVNENIERLFGSFPDLETQKANSFGFSHDGSLSSLVEKALSLDLESDVSL